MENVITEVSKYLIILLMMIYTFSCFTVFRKRDIEDQKNVLRRQIVLMLFMNLVAYTVLFLQNNDMKMLMMYGAVFFVYCRGTDSVSGDLQKRKYADCQ